MYIVGKLQDRHEKLETKDEYDPGIVSLAISITDENMCGYL